MKKTTQTNIGGFVFNMDDDAYLATEQYLNALKQHFKTEESADEILEDIEWRMAEIFKEAIKNKREVVTLSDVQQMIEIMGQPEMITEEKKGDTQEEKVSFSTGHKRLYRDPEHKVIGGVCGGLAAYFNIDPIIFRLVFGIMFIVWGTGVMIYVLLWIAMPKAKTRAEKLEMRGERINVSNLEKQVKEEVGGIKDGIKNMQHSSFFQRLGKGIQEFFQALSDLLYRFLKISGKLIGIALIISGIVLLILLFSIVFMGTTSIIQINDNLFHLSTGALLNIFSQNPIMHILTLTAISIIIGIPMLMMIYAGIKLLFNIKSSNKWLNISSFALWALGLILGSYVVISMVKEFSESFVVTNEKTVSIQKGQTWVFQCAEKKEMQDGFFGMDNAGKLYPIGDVRLNIIHNQENDSITKIEIIKFSRGKTREEASMYAKKIQYDVIQTDTTLLFEPVLLMTYADMYRNQHIRITLKIPEKQKVYLAPGMEAILYDVKNVLDTWDNNMVGYTWIMERKGLDCLDCPKQMRERKNADEDEND